MDKLKMHSDGIGCIIVIVGVLLFGVLFGFLEKYLGLV